MTPQATMWLIFNTAVPAILLFDVLVLQKESKPPALKESAGWVIFWVALAMLFNLCVYSLLGRQKAMEFLTAYLIEESLSLDNMFVFIMIFEYFAVPQAHRRRILHWGILMAIVLRLFFIFAGVALLEKFHWMIYVFGAVLVLTGVRMAVEQEQKIEPEKNILLRLFKKVIPFVDRHDGPEFFARTGDRLAATTYFATLLVIAFSDLVFAIDSIPAVLAISGDFFIVATSNVFAVLGLRALFFLIAGLVGMFRYLRFGIAFILVFVGVKMMIAGFYKISIGASLGVVAGILLLSIIASVIAGWKK